MSKLPSLKALLLLATMCGAATAQPKHEPLWLNEPKSNDLISWIVTTEGAYMPDDNSAIAFVTSYRNGAQSNTAIVSVSGCRQGMGHINSSYASGISSGQTIWHTKGLTINDGMATIICRSGFTNKGKKGTL